MRPTLIRILLVFLAAGLLLLLAPALVDNLRHLGYLSQGNAALPPGAAGSSFSCRETWLETMALHNAGGQPAEATWLSFLTCGPDYLPLLQAVQPANRTLAGQAAALYPADAKIWFWLGEIDYPKDKAAAVEDYQKVVHLDPSFGIAWCWLGLSLEPFDQPQNALEAFLNCCRLGDPGRNGCLGAGRIYEKLNDNPAAIAAYRRSIWPPALQRADELEKQLKP